MQLNTAAKEKGQKKSFFLLFDNEVYINNKVLLRTKKLTFINTKSKLYRVFYQHPKWYRFFVVVSLAYL